MYRDRDDGENVLEVHVGLAGCSHSLKRCNASPLYTVRTTPHRQYVVRPAKMSSGGNWARDVRQYRKWTKTARDVT